MVEVDVELGARRYPIYIGPGILTALGRFLADGPFTRRALVVTDDAIAALYAAVVQADLTRHGFTVSLQTVTAGETAKTLDNAAALYTAAIDSLMDRHSPVIALGGGVVGDLAGFVAATLFRGVPFIQVPTTLLAQVDSSVGGKVAVNHPSGKNLIGAFYQPSAVFADTAVLGTLPPREIRSGLAEIIKYGVIASPAVFAYLAEHAEDILSAHPSHLAWLVEASCRIKAGVVAQDERDEGARAVLNFGHTVGHAVERCAGFGRYTHGEAVAIGMYAASLLSQRLGLCYGDTVKEIKDMLARYGLPVTAPGLAPAELLAALRHDKKSIAGRINWILVKAIGTVTISAEVPTEEVRQVLAAIT